MLGKKMLRGVGALGRGESALHRPCMFFNLVVCHPYCVVWLAFIVGQVAFKIKKL